LERRIQEGRAQRVRRRRRSGLTELHGPDFALVRAGRPDRRVGISLVGGCDLPALFGIVSLVEPGFTGELAVHQQSVGMARARSDFLLASLRDGASAAQAEARSRLQLPDDYFLPTAFDPQFDLGRHGSFPKRIVALSMAADLIRPLYRHRRDGFLVDPGGWWLNRSVDPVLDDGSGTLAWFREEFEPLGRKTVEEFRADYRALVPELQDRTGADVVVFNTLVVEPADPTHSFQLRPRAEGLRRRSFLLALAELAGELGFSVVDVDDVLKRHGIDEQLDFAHFPTSAFGPLAREGLRVVREAGVI
jgi:hypothetical protein